MPDDDLARAVRGGELDRLVDHRDRHVEALDRELLLAQVGLVHEALERVDLDQALQQRVLLVGGQRLAELARLDLLAQPHALAVAGDVLDLVGDRAAVGLAQVRQRVGQRRARHVHAQDLGRDPGHDLGRQADGVGSSAGSPSGSVPSGSSRAARWPWVRWAFSSEVAACTACSSSSSTRRARRRRPRPLGARRRAAAAGRGRRGRRPSAAPSEAKTPS